ncbi:MAG: ornithine carbamoyltransferase [Actinomycetota bacterium]|nr:ornithine carbamoyltransferase [Actinomycetota bacterium]
MVKHVLRGSDFLSLSGLSGNELEDFVYESCRLKKEGTKGFRPLSNRSIGLLFEKPSTRTRVSFEVAILSLGGHPLVLQAEELQMRRGETIEDTAKVLSRYLDGLVVRTFGQKRLESIAASSDIPVINALSDECHPCQALADMLTILEYKGEFRQLELSYLGDGNNVTHSLMRAGTKLGMNVHIATPCGHEPMDSIVSECEEYCEISGGSLKLTDEPFEAAENADILYTDVWVSMGSSEDADEARSKFLPFQVNEKMLEVASDDVIVMHCLPAHRGEEITDDVIDGSHSVVWDQAENRLHAQIALLAMIYG